MKVTRSSLPFLMPIPSGSSVKASPRTSRPSFCPARPKRMESSVETASQRPSSRAWAASEYVAKRTRLASSTTSVAQVRLRRGALARAHLDAGGHEVVDGLVRAVALDEDLLAGQVIDLAEVDLLETLRIARHRADDDVHPVLLEERDPVGTDRLDELRLDPEGAGDLPTQVGIEALDVTGCRVAEAERDHVELDATHELARRADRVERGSFGGEARRGAGRPRSLRGCRPRSPRGCRRRSASSAAPVAPPPLLHAARSRPPATRSAASRRIVSPSADPGRGPVASAGGWFRGSASFVPARGRRSTARACRSPRPHRGP